MQTHWPVEISGVEDLKTDECLASDAFAMWQEKCQMQECQAPDRLCLSRCART